MHALKLADDGRVLYATALPFASESYVTVETMPDGDITQYRYVDGEYVYDPLPVVEPVPTKFDVIEAQVTYTAMMTDTLLEV